MQIKLHIFGDSILKGVILNEVRGRYITSNEIGYDVIAERLHLEICNHSKFGCTVTRGETYLRHVIDQGVRGGICLLEYGGNDCDFDWRAVAEAPNAEHLPNTPLPLFCETYHRMISLAKSVEMTPIVVGLPPISSTRYLTQIGGRDIDTDAVLTWLGDAGAIYRYQERYARAVAEIAAQEGVEFVDLRAPFLAVRRMETILCADGIHPNADGQHIIGTELMRALSAHTQNARIAG